MEKPINFQIYEDYKTRKQVLEKALSLENLAEIEKKAADMCADFFNTTSKEVERIVDLVRWSRLG